MAMLTNCSIRGCKSQVQQILMKEQTWLDIKLNAYLIFTHVAHKDSVYRDELLQLLASYIALYSISVLYFIPLYYKCLLSWSFDVPQYGIAFADRLNFTSKRHQLIWRPPLCDILGTQMKLVPMGRYHETMGESEVKVNNWILKIMGRYNSWLHIIVAFSNFRGYIFNFIKISKI